MLKRLNKGISTILGIIIILSFSFLFGGVTVWQYFEMEKQGLTGVEINIPEKSEDVIQPEKTVKHYENLAKENKDESYCEMIDVLEARGLCYSDLAILKDEPSICWKVETASLASSCWEYFRMKEWQIYRNDEYGFEFRYPDDFFFRKPEFIVSDCDHAGFTEKCPDIGVTGAMVTKPVKLTINDISYCVQTTSEGAVGTIYTEEYYTTVREGKCLTIYLALSFTNCGVFGSTGDEDYEQCKYENTLTKPETLNQVITTFNFLE